MRRTIRFLVVLIPCLLLATSGGCRMCYTEYDYTSPAFGGIVSENPCGGRVGSAFCCEGGAPVQSYPQEMVAPQTQPEPYYDESGTTSVVQPAPATGGGTSTSGTTGI